MSIVSAPDRKHRQEFMNFCLHHADPRVKPWVDMLYTAWADYNSLYFNDQLDPPYILIGPTSSTASYGETSFVSEFGGTLQIKIKRSLLEGTHAHFETTNVAPADKRLGQQRFVLDVLLHEMVHQYCVEELGAPETAEKGHGPVFARECNRVGALMTPSLPDVGQARASRRKPGVPSCAQWPVNVRPSDYYKGAYNPNGVQTQPTTPTAPQGQGTIPGTLAQVTVLQQQIAALQAQLSTVTGERDQARADLHAVRASVPTPDNRARAALIDAFSRGVKPSDARGLSGLLSDLCPDLRLERSLLVQAAGLGVGDLGNVSQVRAQYAQMRLTARLTSDYGIAPDLARWAVETWVAALAAHVAAPVLENFLELELAVA